MYDKMLIYILEDDESIRELEAFAMKNSGYETACFDNSKDFYKAISKKVPDLILLDIMLPGDDGLTILTKLREDTVFSKILVIIISAKTTELDRFTGEDFRITLIEKDGTVVFESAADPQDIEKMQTAIKDAYKDGEGILRGTGNSARTQSHQNTAP